MPDCKKIKEPKSNNLELSTALLVLISDMKLGMMDVGILCKDPRFGISTEKGTACDLHTSLYMLISMWILVPFHYSKILCLFFPPDCSITKFLNRILGLEVHKQNFLFQYFTENFDYLIEKDKKEGKYDMGILGMVASSRFLTCYPETET